MRQGTLELALSEQGLQATRDFLSRTRDAENDLALLHARMDQLRNRRDRLEGDVTGSRERAEVLLIMSRMEEEILERYRQLLAIEGEVAGLIALLPDATHRRLMEMRHVHLLSMYQVAELLHMDERNAYRIYKKALQVASLIYHQNQTEQKTA